MAINDNFLSWDVGNLFETPLRYDKVCRSYIPEFVSNAVLQPKNNILVPGRRAYFIRSKTVNLSCTLFCKVASRSFWEYGSSCLSPVISLPCTMYGPQWQHLLGSHDEIGAGTEQGNLWVFLILWVFVRNGSRRWSLHLQQARWNPTMTVNNLAIFVWLPLLHPKPKPKPKMKQPQIKTKPNPKQNKAFTKADPNLGLGDKYYCPLLCTAHNAV